MAWPAIAWLFALATLVDVTARVRSPGSLPPEATLTIHTAGENAGGVDIGCILNADQSLLCKAPAGRFDLRLVVPGFAPVYRWDVDLSGPSVNLGTIVARPGGSISGTVIGGRDGTPLPEAAIDLIELGTDERSIQHADSDARGFFQFTGVEPGTYAIRAASKEASPAYRTNVVVNESTETFLEKAISISPLSRLEMDVLPSGPAPGQSWQIRLWRRIPLSHNDRIVAEVDTDEFGHVEIGELEDGHYEVHVRDAAGTTFATRHIEVEGGVPPLFLQVWAVPIRGRVRSGSTPIQAQVRLRTDSGENLRIASDQDGEFRSLLPAEGMWRVAVRLPNGQSLDLRPIEIQRRDTEEFARVEIDVPPGRIVGRVVDGAGNGVRTGVRLTRKGVPETAIMSDADGFFDLLGLATGDVVLDAGDRELQSGPIPLTIADDLPPITITVRKTRALRGFLSMPSGHPVVGATIHFWDDAWVVNGEAMTNLSGAFEIPLPATTSVLNASIVATGIPLKLLRIALPNDEDRIKIITAPVAGRLVIPLSRASGQLPTVSSAGVTTSLMWLLRPTSIGGMRPPALTPEGAALEVEPGRYSVCVAGRCSTVDVAPGATVRVENGE